MSSYEDRPYEVGKGKPPKSTRWKPGQSGNPLGSKAKKKPERAPLAVILYEIMNQPVTVRMPNGREIKLSKKYAIVMNIINDAMTATPHQRLKAFKLLVDAGAYSLDVQDPRRSKAESEQAIADLVRMLGEEALRDHRLRVKHGEAPLLTAQDLAELEEREHAGARELVD